MADNYLFDGLLADKLATPDGRNALFATLPEDGRRYTYGDVEDVSGRFANVLVDLARLDNAPRSRALSAHLVTGIRGAVGEVYKHPQRQAGFSVLKAADIPSVLIEVAFLSTSGELRKLRDPMWRANMAAGIRDGLSAWTRDDAATSHLRRR